MTAALHMQGLGYKLGNHYILKEIDWQVAKGEHWVVFGTNGSGKTTLLAIAAGFTDYTHGDLEVLGQHYHADNIFELRRRVGWVSGSFYDKYFSREIVLDMVLAGKFGTLGIENDITDGDVRRAKALLKELRMGRKFHYPFDLLSKGERQNVLIARSLMTNPEILILDEPCTGLDVFSREYLLRTIEDLAKNTEITIIFVTHHPDEILDIFSNCLLLQEGHIYAKDRTDKLFTSEKMSQFLNYPITVKHHDNRIAFHIEVDSNIKTVMETL